MNITISTSGRLTLPIALRKQDGIEAGQQFSVARLAPGEYLLTRRDERENAGLVDWLLTCPVKGFFVPIESETTQHVGTHFAEALPGGRATRGSQAWNISNCRT